MSIEKPHQPSPEEIKKAEEVMTEEQKEKSEERKDEFEELKKFSEAMEEDLERKGYRDSPAKKEKYEDIEKAVRQKIRSDMEFVEKSGTKIKV